MKGRTLPEVFDEVVHRYGDLPALRWRSGSQWSSYTWTELREQVEFAALGLRDLGVRPGDRVGVLVSNRPELAVVDFALLHARAVPVCLFESFTDEQLATVLSTLDIDLVIAEGQAGLDRLPGASRLVVVAGPVPGATSWERVVATGRELAARADGTFEAVWRAALPDELVSVNYTSGTTGSLKGVRHTHRNVLWHAESFARFMPLRPGSRFLSYLPRAHATERFASTWYPLTQAATVHLCPDPAALADYLRDVRPQFFGGVLRVWEKMYAGAAAVLPADQAASAPGPVLDAVRAQLGLDECRFAFSGGGALAEEVQRYFSAIGVRLVEGWGQSELVSAAACGRPDAVRIGTVGQALPGVEIRAAHDGELLVRSGGWMLGYAGTAAEPSLIDDDGWVGTGDLGRVDDDGYVRLYGRRQEVFRLADGHLVAATRVESQLRANLVVDQACVVGEGEPDLCAILVVTDPDQDVASIVREANKVLTDRDRIVRFAVLEGPWVPGRAEELTHTGKLKRALIASKYADLVEALYRGEAGTPV